MQIFFFVEVGAILLITLLLLNRYAAKDISIYVKALIFIPWFLNFVMIVLVPVDVYYSYGFAETADKTPVPNEHGEDPGSAEVYLLTGWRIVYWTTFGFTWVVLPFLQEYVDSGEFSIQEKIKRSIRNSLLTYGVMAIFGVFFIIYLIISKQMSASGVLEFLITFSNIFGIFLIIMCLGFGLVHIPRRYLQHTNKQVNLKYHKFQLAEVDYDKVNLQIELEDTVKLIHLLSIRKDIDASHKELLERVLAQCSEELVQSSKQTLNSTDHSNATDMGPLTRSKIVSLNRKIRKSLREMKRIENKYDTTLRDALQAEDVLLCLNADQWEARSNPENLPQSGFAKCLNALSFIWYTKVEQVIYFIFGCLFGIFSIIVFLAEILSFDNVRFLNIHYLMNEGDSFVKSQLMCLTPLFYISLCVYSSLFSMKISGVYGLYPNKHTDAGSLVFTSINFSRVSAPLVFNFFKMLEVKETSFNQIMGEPEVALSFTQYFPLLLILLILFNVFDVYGKIFTWLGFSRFNFSENFNDEKIEEGNTILIRARRGKSMSGSKIISSAKTRKSSNESVDFTLNAKLLHRPVDSTSDSEDGRKTAKESEIDSPAKLLGSKSKSKRNGWK